MSLRIIIDDHHILQVNNYSSMMSKECKECKGIHHDEILYNSFNSSYTKMNYYYFHLSNNCYNNRMLNGEVIPKRKTTYNLYNHKTDYLTQIVFLV